jgi:2-polyprenyl-6-methoxyphenol hydroxylase-like FAD-dependent oxidoreductase
MNRPLPSPPHFDVLIIGGGPAGSTAGAWLGKKGCKALICEKEQFPRFHIGESLLPNGNRILKEIGVWEKIENAGFIKKYGAEFTLADRSKGVRNNFSEGLMPLPQKQWVSPQVK